jgi:hypothetical protein
MCRGQAFLSAEPANPPPRTASAGFADFAVALCRRMFVGNFICVWIGHHRQMVRLTEPTPQIDRPAPLAAERHSRRRFSVKFTIANRTTHMKVSGVRYQTAENRFENLMPDT